MQTDDTSGVDDLGGAPSGSTTTAFIARKGLALTVLERERLPRQHLGEPMHAASAGRRFSSMCSRSSGSDTSRVSVDACPHEKFLNASRPISHGVAVHARLTKYQLLRDHDRI